MADLENVSLIDIIEDIRREIYRPPVSDRLVQDATSWNILESALQVMETTEHAFDDYLEHPAQPSTGELFLMVCGLMQSLVLQQDVVRKIHQGIGMQYKPQSGLKDIRVLRHKSIGHPMERLTGRARDINFVAKENISYDRFEILSKFADGRPDEIIPVVIPELIEMQRNIHKSLLFDVHAKLQE